MNFRFPLSAAVCLLCVQATLTATTNYTFGSSNTGTNPGISLANEPTAYVAGFWTENFTGGAGTTEQIDCVVPLQTIVDTCGNGNGGVGTAQHIPIPAAPGSSGILSSTNYFEADGDPTYGAPISTNMTGLTPGATYQISFAQATSEENGNAKAYTDIWKIYIIPNGVSGVYICPVCATPVDPIPGDLAYTSPSIANTPTGGLGGGGNPTSTPWEAESFTFTVPAATTSEILEFVTDAVAVAGGAFMPPILDLASVSSTQVTPEPGTFVLMLLGIGLIFVARMMRRRSSARG